MNGISKHRTRPVPREQEEFARALGWFSLALGTVELLFPRALGRLIGTRRRHNTLMRFLGVREIASGLGILAEPKYPAWVWSRLGGDVMDLSLLALAMASPRGKHGRLAMATAAVAGVTALDLICSEELTRTRQMGGNNGSIKEGRAKVKAAVTVNRPAEEVYRFWREFQNLPKIMPRVRSIEDQGNGHSRWVAEGPLGKEISWEAEITEDRPNERIAWRSVPNGRFEHSGTVRFERATGDRGTVVRIEMDYHAAAGALGAAIATVTRREPGVELKEALLHLRQILETGGVPTTQGQSTGRRQSTSRKFDYAMPQPRTHGETQFAH